MSPPVVLTIAGSDSGGGAGIQADLKALAAHGVHGTSALTAVTAQNTVGVQGIHPVPTDVIDAQITSIVTDMELDASKTGMLATREVIDLVAKRAATGDLPNLVVDPVMVAASGDRLLDEAAVDGYVEDLFEQATVVTPNLFEASLLVGRELDTIGEMEDAAKQIAETGADCVVVKGGHLDGGDSIDVVYAEGEISHLRAQRIETPNVHGTGCTFASTIAAWLARGASPTKAVQRAKDYITTAIAGGAGWHLGAGPGPVDHFGWEQS